MCCCGCAMAVLEPGPGFGSWRALFGFGPPRNRKRRSSMKAKDVMTAARHHHRSGRLDSRSVAADAAKQDQRPAGGRQGRKPGRHRHRRRLPAPIRDRNRAQAAALGRIRARPGNAIARDYVHSHARRIDEVMTAGRRRRSREDAELDDVVALMEKHRVKRVPVMRGSEARRDRQPRQSAARAGDPLSRSRRPAPRPTRRSAPRVLAELDRQSWAPRHMIDVVVRNGVVELWGTVIDPDQRDAARVVAETVPGSRP